MAKFRKGQSGNPNGRPRGSRNKSSLIKAQLTLDDAANIAAEVLVGVLGGDETLLEKYGIKGEITPKLKLEAAKMMLQQVSGEMKALSAEQKKGGDTPSSQAERKATFSRTAGGDNVSMLKQQKSA